MSHQAHRGPASEDGRLFASTRLPPLRTAAADFCWLLDRDYAPHSALELVGNRYSLAARQRMAILRHSCSEKDVIHRKRSRIEPSAVRGRELWVDGYNVLTLIESALSGGIVIACRDKCFRDIAGIHRRYRKVSETIPALQLIGEAVSKFEVSVCRWWLDRPVSNSGRLKTIILEMARSKGWNMEVEVVFSPDHVLSHTEHVVASSDGIILNRCTAWLNLAREIIIHRIPAAHIINLARDED
jgi:hypothetical protein